MAKKPSKGVLSKNIEAQKLVNSELEVFRQDTGRAWEEIRSVLNRHKHESFDASALFKELIHEKCGAIEARIQEARDVLLKQMKDESLDIVKGYRALTHFSWEKLAETEDRIIQAQNAATKIATLASVAQCILTLAVVGVMLWFR